VLANTRRFAEERAQRANGFFDGEPLAVDGSNFPVDAPPVHG
jgi:hypothetical protein